MIKLTNTVEAGSKFVMLIKLYANYLYTVFVCIGLNWPSTNQYF